MGLGNWAGYALSAGYYIGLDYGMGETVCEIFGYGYYIVDGLHWLIDFGADSMGVDTEIPEELPTVAESTVEVDPAAAAGIDDLSVTVGVEVSV